MHIEQFMQQSLPCHTVTVQYGAPTGLYHQGDAPCTTGIISIWALYFLYSAARTITCSAPSALSGNICRISVSKQLSHRPSLPASSTSPRLHLQLCNRCILCSVRGFRKVGRSAKLQGAVEEVLQDGRPVHDPAAPDQHEAAVPLQPP